MKNTINSVRFLGVDAINLANSGHPGIVLGAAPMATELFLNHLKATAKDSKWFNRDRFVMAAGHGSALLYSLLHHAGYKVTMDDLKAFRQLGSKTPGHPELGHTDGIDATSGPLGQGIAQAAGIAAAERFLSQKYNKPRMKIVDHFTFALCGDGDLQEGVTSETMDWAGHIGLGKLIVLYDSNDIQLDGPTSMTDSVNWKMRCRSMKWQHILVENGNDPKEIAAAIKAAKKDLTRPSMVEIKTIIGEGTSVEGLSDTHGSPIGDEERAIAAEKLGHKLKPFKIDSIAKAKFKKSYEANNKKLEKWNTLYAKYETAFPKEFKELNNAIKGNFKANLIKPKMFHELGESHATRNIGGKCINELSDLLPTFLGGSADLTKSTKAKGADGNFPEKGGRNINFGVREFAMTAIANGMTIHGGVKVFTGAFFVFSDYAKPAIRMAALQKINPIYIYTHDSVAVGEDGPTHQPVEQMVGLRAIPNVNLIRPCDANETVAAFQVAVKEKTRPTVIVLSRQNLEVVSTAKAEDIENGAYIVQKEEKKLKLCIIATGSEVSTVIEAVKGLVEYRNIRIISMPSTNNFDATTKDYRNMILPSTVKTMWFESGSMMTGHKYADIVYGINTFGESAPGNEVLEHFGFTPLAIRKFIRKNMH